MTSMRRLIEIGFVLFLLYCNKHAFAQDQSAIISFDNPDLIAALEELLENRNISAHLEEVYECEQDPVPCDALAECADVMHTYACTCQEGYVGAFNADYSTHKCTDIDECQVLDELKEVILNQLDIWSTEITNCNSEGITTECKVNEHEIYNFTMKLEGSYEHYNVVNNSNNNIFQLYSGQIDSDILSSLTTFLPCDTSSSCLNLNATYQCNCLDGFVGNISGCVDVDECEEDPTLCAGEENTECSNTIGTYTCACIDGYYYSDDFGSCVDVDECGLMNECTSNSHCINTVGSYDCSCNTGFKGDGWSCFDIDECVDDMLNDCATNGRCVNTDGSFHCTCNEGYTGNGNTCFATTEDCFTSFLPECINSTGSLSCEFAQLNPSKALEIYNSFRYFFLIPEEVKEKICSPIATNETEISLFHSTDDATRICDIEFGLTYRQSGYSDEEGENQVEIFNYDQHFQWFDTRTCKDKHAGSSPIGCVQRYLMQKALTIEKVEEKFHFDVKQIYFESGCEVAVFV